MRIVGWILLALVYFIAPQDYSAFDGLNLRSVFFFGTGVFLGMNKRCILEISLKNKTWSLVLFLPLLFVCTWFNGSGLLHNYLLKILYITGIFVLFNVMNILLDRKGLMDTLSFLSQTVFFIYGSHITMKGILKGTLLRFVSNSSSVIGMSFGFFVVWAATVVACLALFFVMKKTCPMILGVLVGKRIEQKV